MENRCADYLMIAFISFNSNTCLAFLYVKTLSNIAFASSLVLIGAYCLKMPTLLRMRSLNKSWTQDSELLKANVFDCVF